MLRQETHQMNIGKKRQTTLRITYTKLPEWHWRVQKMQECKTLDALITLHGPPQHKVQQQGHEIWHYTLGVESGLFYSIHVSVWPDQSKQVILYFEPATRNHFQPNRKWWQFWKKNIETAVRQRL